ncbi:MAG: hypothetical protein ACOZIN_10290 [Myxococcota bacterium]
MARPPIGPYEKLAERAAVLEVMGHPCRVISIDDLIAGKAHLGREKDRMVERELRAIRDRLRGKSPS